MREWVSLLFRTHLDGFGSECAAFECNSSFQSNGASLSLNPLRRVDQIGVRGWELNGPRTHSPSLFERRSNERGSYDPIWWIGRRVSSVQPHFLWNLGQFNSYNPQILSRPKRPCNTICFFRFLTSRSSRICAHL
jgi:hypothetical protein